MPTRKKAKGKTKAKRKKPPVAKATTRRKTARKKPAKAPVRHSSPKKATPTANAAVKPRPSGPSVLSVAVTPMPSLPAQPAPPGERIGVVSHYYSHLSVATLRLESGTLRVGDVIHIRGHTTGQLRQSLLLFQTTGAMSAIGTKRTSRFTA
ncbi:MAG: hypothetical protein WCA54_15345 [Pseudolabrys sp.]